MPANETRLRTLTRSLTWRATGVLLAVFLTWLLTGDLRTGIELGITYNAVRFVTQYAHDRWWARVAWGTLRHDASQQPASKLEGVVPPRSD